MTKYWIVHSKVNTKPLTDWFVSHRFWYTNYDIPEVQNKVKQIEGGDKIAYHVGGKIKAVGVVAKKADISPFPLFFMKDVVEFEPASKSPVKFPEVLGTIHGPYGAADEKVKAIWGDEG